MPRSKTEIFSIFGQCDAVAAEMMVREGKLTRIEPEDIPASAAVNEAGTRARFAVVVPHQHLREFQQRCREMYL
jgi:hypothetical protein